MKTRNLFQDQLHVTNLVCQHMSCTNVNSKKKEFVECESEPISDLKYCYSQLYYLGTPSFTVTTPVMLAPFGITQYKGGGLSKPNKFTLCLQFTDYKTDPDMKRFYQFIQECEYRQMELLGLTDQESPLYISQIKQDPKKQYDPNLDTRVPFSYNQFQCDIYADNYDGVCILDVKRFSKVQCDIYLDKIWRYNDMYVSKWKVNMIHLL